MNSEDFTQPINLYLSAEHKCSYLDNRLANSLFVDPEATVDMVTYSELIQRGFRRSGNYVYTPYCNECHECIPVRVDVRHFTPTRSQRRCWNKNKDLQIKACPGAFNPHHYDLYEKYVLQRHIGGGMDKPSKEKYLEFLTSNWCNSTFFEFRENDKVVSVAVTDLVQNGFSAVYTFFSSSPRMDKRSLGVFSILWQITEAKRRNLQWVYLGYWIKECEKMSYKDKYQPLQYFYNYKWHGLPPAEPTLV